MQGSGVPSVWLLVCFRSNGVSLELSILVFGYVSIKLYVLMPQKISVGPVGVTVGMKQIRYFFHLIFDKCVFLAHSLIFDAISVLCSTGKSKGKGLAGVAW